MTKGPIETVGLTYNDAVEQVAKGTYGALPKAKFEKETLMGLAKASQEGVTWEKLPARIKLCMVRLAMAMLPAPVTAEGKPIPLPEGSGTVEPEAAKPDKVIPPAHAQTGKLESDNGKGE